MINNSDVGVVTQCWQLNFAVHCALGRVMICTCHADATAVTVRKLKVYPRFCRGASQPVVVRWLTVPVVPACGASPMQYKEGQQTGIGAQHALTRARLVPPPPAVAPVVRAPVFGVDAPFIPVLCVSGWHISPWDPFQGGRVTWDECRALAQACIFRLPQLLCCWLELSGRRCRLCSLLV